MAQMTTITQRKKITQVAADIIFNYNSRTRLQKKATHLLKYIACTCDMNSAKNPVLMLPKNVVVFNQKAMEQKLNMFEIISTTKNQELIRGLINHFVAFKP